MLLAMVRPGSVGDISRIGGCRSEAYCFARPWKSAPSLVDLFLLAYLLRGSLRLPKIRDCLSTLEGKKGGM